MVPYIALFVAIAALCLLAEASSSSRKPAMGDNREAAGGISEITRSYFLWIAVGLLVLFSALRSDVGTDFQAYVNFYDRLDPARWMESVADSTQEPGFTALILAVKSFTGSPQALFWVCALLTVPPIYVALRKGSTNPTLALLLYVLMIYPASFNASRQSVAAALLVLAWVYLNKRRLLFLVAAAVIGAIHISAVLVAVILILVQLIGWSKRLIAVIMFAVSCAAVLVNIWPAALEALTWLNSDYANYINSGESGLGAYLQVLFYVSILVFSVTYGVEDAPLTEDEKTYASFALVAIAFMIVGTQAVVVFRMSLFFLAFVVLLVASRVGRVRKTVPSLLIVCAAVLYYFAYLLSYGDSVPYQSVLSP